MNLKRDVSGLLYNAIKEKYERGLYRDAILAAILHLEEAVCIKANLERIQLTTDPFGSFNQAFDGSDPLIRINSMTTLGQILEQQGFSSMLIGLYQTVRNPRIHTEYLDTEKTANAIIVFIDYLIQKIQNGTTLRTAVINQDEHNKI